MKKAYLFCSCNALQNSRYNNFVFYKPQLDLSKSYNPIKFKDCIIIFTRPASIHAHTSNNIDQLVTCTLPELEKNNSLTFFVEIYTIFVDHKITVYVSKIVSKIVVLRLYFQIELISSIYGLLLVLWILQDQHNSKQSQIETFIQFVAFVVTFNDCTLGSGLFWEVGVACSLLSISDSKVRHMGTRGQHPFNKNSTRKKAWNTLGKAHTLTTGKRF